MTLSMAMAWVSGSGLPGLCSSLRFSRATSHLSDAYSAFSLSASSFAFLRRAVPGSVDSVSAPRQLQQEV